MTTIIGLAGLLALLAQAPLPAASPAQTAQAAEASVLSKRLATNDRLVLLDSDGHRIEGRFIGLSTAGLTLVDPDGRPNTVALPRISKIVREDSKRNGLLIGLAAGLGAGIFGGAMFNAICENETGGCPEFIFFLGGVGAAAGAGIGAAADGMRKEVIYAPGAPAPDDAAALGLFKPEVALNIGGGHFSGFGMGMTAPVSLGGSWSFRQRAGIGVRFDVSRTLAESRHVVECVRDLSGRCAGSGEEGVNKIFIGTAQVTYHFSRLGRVQPYIGGGLGLHNTIVQRAFAVALPGRPVTIDSAPASTTQASMVVSGGTRIAVTKSLAIDPAVTFIDAKDLSGVRASIGIAYGW